VEEGEEKERQGPKKDKTNPRWGVQQNPFVNKSESHREPGE